MDIYAQNILDRYKEPLYKDKDIKVVQTCNNKTMSCGDNIDVNLEIEDGKVKDYSYSGAGCAISMASADILGDLIIGMTLEELSEMSEKDLIEALGIEISPRRSGCALLAFNALKKLL